MIIEFHKYHGTGNDFVIVDETKLKSGLDRLTITRICDRHTGIGADGLILLKNTGEDEFSMEYFNADGSTGALCGNGGRCAAALADFLTVHPADRFKLHASDGLHIADITGRSGNRTMVRITIHDVGDIRDTGNGLFLNTGAPHLVTTRKNLDEVDVTEEGRELRNSPDHGPEGTNVNFVDFNREPIRVRTYERGVEDETFSCGTGVTAVALAYAREKKIMKGPVEIATRGGKLKVDFVQETDGSFKEISLEGPAVRVFSGHLELWNIRKED